MKRVNMARMTMLLSAVMISGVLSAGELLMNAGFEEKVVGYDKSGWDNRGPRVIQLVRVTEPVLEGSKALLVEGRGAQKWEGIRQEVTLKANKTYRISGAMRMGKGEASGKGVVQLVKKLSNGKMKFQDLFRGNLSEGKYTKFEKVFSFSEKGVKQMFISVHGPADGKSFIVDNFSLTEVD